MTDTCKDCREPVVHLITEGGRDIELDPDPHPEGTVVTVQVGRQPRARVLTSRELPHAGEAWQRHSSTCTNSAAARQRRAKRGPRCHVCTNPMDAELAEREHWETHPCCDPDAGAATVRAALTNRKASA